MTISYTQFSNALLVGILEHEEREGKSSADLAIVCENQSLPFNEDWLCRFLNEQNNKTGSGAGVVGLYSFELNEYGRERAAKHRRDLIPKTFVEHLTGETSQKLINIGNFAIAGLALVIAAIALFKD